MGPPVSRAGGYGRCWRNASTGRGRSRLRGLPSARWSPRGVSGFWRVTLRAVGALVLLFGAFQLLFGPSIGWSRVFGSALTFALPGIARWAASLIGSGPALAGAGDGSAPSSPGSSGTGTGASLPGPRPPGSWPPGAEEWVAHAAEIRAAAFRAH
ncbi:MAG: hypothetical protein ACREC5_05675, partial [Thermoplasmata archaeon]